MMRTSYRLVLLALVCVLGAAVLRAALPDPSPASASPDKATPSVDFTRDIQPLLAARCFKCHGLSKQEAELSFSSPAAATRELPSGARAIVPRDAVRSELIKRIVSTNPDERMPPKGQALSAGEVDLLRRWIAAGADWPEHWAWRPLSSPKVPERVATQNLSAAPESDNPVDRFLQAALAQRRLHPAPPADRRTLLRRVSFDLTGLPPSPEDLAAFEADTAPDAYERVVDRLLASPRYGERSARMWMDLVHFAETHGHDQDRIREHAWPYRDYLIRAFNADLPFDRFVEQQIAGDVLFPADPWATIATGFLASGPWDESSLRDIREDTPDREIGRYLDRDDIVTTVFSTFASTTVHCARCHDHKIDPVSQSEYYGLQAVFAGTDKANRSLDRDPAVAARRSELAARKARLGELRTGKTLADLDGAWPALFAAWEQSLSAAGNRWQSVEHVAVQSQNGSLLTQQPDGSLLAGGTRPEKDVYTITVRTPLKQVTAVRIDVLTDPSLPHSGPGRQENGNLHLNELAVFALESGKDSPPKKLSLRNPRADFNQQGWSVDLALDGRPETAWGIYPEVGKPHRAVFELADPLAIGEKTQLRFELHQIHGGGHLIGRVKLSVTDRAVSSLPSEPELLPPELTAILAVPAASRTAEQKASLAVWFAEQQLQRDQAALPKPQLVYCGTSRFDPDGSFKPAAAPRPVQILARGVLTSPLGEARPRALSLVGSLSPELTISAAGDEGARRAALARWLSDRRNGLVWRSIANRVWQQHFVRGLVDSPNDFGRMGSAPTHPELLEWLVVYLQEQGGSLKSLHRLLLTSAAYRQASVLPPAALAASDEHPSPLAVDADNRLLWRYPRRRLEAEQLHDAILVHSGQLDGTMGGPSVRQFTISPGVHVTPTLDYTAYSADDPGNRRRSVYRFVFRTLPDPFMDALDCPDASQLSPQRTESVTALAALATLHDKFIARQSQLLAQRLSAAGPSPAQQVSALFREVLLRHPTEGETTAMTVYVTKHGLANACRMLLNSNEFMFIE